MNKIYRLVWNKSLNIWTVVSENARGVTKKRNVAANISIKTVASLSLKQDKHVQLKPTLIVIALSSFFFNTHVFAATNTGGGTVSNSNGSSMAISPTASQCGTEASVSGNNGLAAGCGNAISGTNNTFQQGLVNSRGTGSNPYPTGRADPTGAATAIGKDNTISNPGGGTALGHSNVINGSGNFHNVAVGQGNHAGGLGYNVAIGIGNEVSNGTTNSSVAIGVDNDARGNTVIAVGRGVQAYADYSIAQGNTATVAAGATGALAFGHSATATGARGIAIGSSTSTAVNYDSATAANASGTDAIAIGTGAKGTGASSTAVGRQAVAAGESSTAMGDQAKADNAGDLALGRSAQATGVTRNGFTYSAVAVGRNALAQGEDALAVGNTAKATANYAGAVGNFAEATGNNAMAVGNSAKASGNWSSAFGNFSEASGVQSAAIGNIAKAIGQRSSALGHGATATGASSIANGESAQAQSDNDIAIGRNAATAAGSDGDNIAMGNGVNTGATGKNVAIGSDGTTANSETAAGGAVAIGRDQVANGDGAVAIGDPNRASGSGAVALGKDNTAAGDTAASTMANGAVAIGNTNQAIGQGSVAIGNTSNAAAAGAIALGDTANAQAERGIALGSNAVATNADDVAIGSGSQTAIAVATESTTIRGETYQFAGTKPTSTVSVGSEGNERTITNVAAGRISATSTDAINGSQLYATNQALEELEIGVAAANSEVTQGKNINVTKTTGADGQDIYNVATADDVSFDSVQVGDVNIDGSTGKISGVTAGTVAADSTEAINGSQLHGTAQSTANALGGGSTVNPDGTVTAPNYTVNGTDVNNVGAAIAELDKGWTLQSNGANGAPIKAGDTVDIGTADGEENLQVAKEGNDIKYSLNRDLKVDSVTAGDTVINTRGVTITNGPSITKKGINAAGKKITNVGAGVYDTDAVNKGQLDTATAAAKTEVEAGKNMTVESETGADGQTIYTVATADDVSFDSVQVGDVNIDGSTGKISGVTAGTVAADSTEAINGSQLHGTAQSTANALGGGSTVNPDGTVTAPNYTVNGTDVNNVGAAIAELDKGWTLQSNGANGAPVKAGDTVDIGTADGEENLQVVKEGNDIKYSLNRDLKVDSVTAGDTVINTDGMTITGGPSVTKSGIDAGNQKITGVAAGDVNPDSTDAVNGSQLDAAAKAAKTEVEAGKNMTVESETGADGQTIYTVATADDVSFDSVQVGDVNIDGSTGKISGVTAGTVAADSTEAINGSQLHGTAQSTANALGGGSTVNPDGTVTAPNYTVNGTDVNNVGAAIAELDKGWTLQSNGANGAPIKAGDTVDIGTADGEENLQVVKEGNDIKYSLNRDLKVDSVTAGDTVINTDGMTITGGPSVTKSGIDAAGNTISNVAPGVVAADSTDAINGSQLHAQGEGVRNIIGGNTVYDPATGEYTNPDIGGTGENNINDAIGSLGRTAAAAKTEVEAGKNMTVESETGADGQTIYTVATADDVSFDSVQVGDVNIDGSTGKISGVAAGDVNPDSTDAINGSQLANNAQSVADALGGGSTVNPDGTVSAPNYTVNGTDVNNVGAAIAELDKGWTLQTNGENAGAVKAGDTVDIGTADGEENLQVAKEGNDIKYSLNRDLKVDSVTAGDTVINTDGMTITGGPSVTKSGIDAGNQKITGVAAGDVNPDSTDAVNGSQLDAAAKAAKTEVTEGKNITVTKTTGDDGQDIYNVATADDVEFNNVKVGDVTIDGTTGKISGVTAGTVAADSTEAINGSQLHGTAQSTANALGGGSTVNPDGTVTAPNYTVNGTDVNNVGAAIAELDKGWTLQSNGANGAPIKAGDTVDIGTADGEENLQVVKEGNDIKYSLNRDLKVDSVTAGDTVINTDGMTITGGPSVTKSGIDAGNQKITGVAAGDVNPDSTDAVNGSQLDAAAKAAKTEVEAGKNMTVESETGADGQTIYTVATADDVSFDSVQVGDVNIDGSTGKISGVTAGTVAADSTEAINGSQLHGVADSVRNSIGGETVLNPDGSITTANVGNTGENNIHDAIDSVRGQAIAAKSTVTEGENIVITESTNADGSTNYEVATARDVNFDSVQVGDVNIDGSTGKISGVTAGDVNTDSTDAINGSQLHNTAQSVSDALGGGSTVNPDGTVTAPDYTVNGNSLNNVGDAITELDKGWTLQTNGENAGAVRAGDTVDIGTADGEENLQVAKEGNDIKYSLNRDLKVDSVTAGNTRLDNTGVEIKDPVGNSTSIVAGGTIVKDAQGNSTAQTAAGTTIKTVQGDTTLVNSTGLAFTDTTGQPVGPSVSRTGIDAGGLKVTNVADGVVAAGSKEAVNGGQLNDTADSVGDILGGGVTNEGGKLNGPFTVNDKGYDTVADAIQGEAAAAKTEVEAGKNMTVESETGTDGQTIYTVATADDVSFDSVQVGDVNIDGSTGKISGVTAGTVAADSTEAINGSQLHGVADSVRNSIGGETVLNPDGSITTANVGNTGQNNIHDAIDSVRGQAVAAKTTVTEGDNMVVTQSTNPDGSTNYEVATARDVNFDSVQVGDVNIDGSTGKISGVTAGTVAADSTEAINGSQLHGTAQSTANALGGGSTVNPDGTVTAPNYTVNGTSLNNVGDAITELDKGWTLQTNGGNAGAVKAGDTVDIGTADGEENLQVVKEGNDIKYSLNRDLKVDSVTAGDSILNNDGLTIAGGPSITKSGINAGGRKLTNVAAGDVTPDSTDAINGSQLHAQGEGVRNIIGGNTTYDPATGEYTNPDIGGTGQDNINDAIGAVGDAAKAAKTTVTEGDNMVVTETKNADGSTNYEVATAKDVKFDSVTATDEEGNETVLTATGTEVKDGEGNEAHYGANGVTLKDLDGNGTVLNSTGLGFVDQIGNNIGPSITAKGIDAGNTVITGVAAGRVAADSTDAINGSQLKGVADSVAGAIGGNTTVSPDGSISTSNIGGTGKDNINDAIGAVGDAAKAAKSTVNEGKNIVVKESKNADGSSNYEVSTAPNLDVESVTAGGTRVDDNGLTIEDGPSVTKVGIDAGDKKVTGVADGEVAAGSKDAVNGGQLRGVSDSVADVIGGNTTVNPDGSLSTSNIGGTGKNNVNDAIESVRGAAAAAKTTVSNKDGNINVNEATKADGSKDFEVGLAKDITVDSVTAKDVNANQVNVGGAGGTTIAADGVRIAEGPSMTKEGINAGGKKVTGVADGAIASGSQDGINGGQLHRSYEDVGKALGGGAGYDPSTGWKGPSYDVAGGKYDNVGDALGAIDNRVTNLGDQLQQAFYDTNKRMDKLEDKMSAGIAATAALENAPFVPGKLTMAAGAAYYNEQSAIGVTFRKTADNGRWSLTTGAAMGSQGNSPLVRVGVSTIID